VDISRTGYTGDLGFEIWIPWNDAVKVWDELMSKGKSFDIHAAGMLALDVARIEAGLILIDVDYNSSKKALIDQQKFFPEEIGLGKLVHLEKEQFIGRKALLEQQKRGFARQLVGLEIDWTHVEQLYESVGLAPQAPSQASRVHVPVYRGKKQIGKATSTTWSPTLKKMIALASIDTPEAKVGNTVEMEITIEAVRYTVRAKIVNLPFYNPPQKTAKIG
jgi:aminomethyltransferase